MLLPLLVLFLSSPFFQDAAPALRAWPAAPVALAAAASSSSLAPPSPTVVGGFPAFVQAAGLSQRAAYLLNRDLISLGVLTISEVTLEDRRQPCCTFCICLATSGFQFPLSQGLGGASVVD